jgi:hypothetical protein
MGDTAPSKILSTSGDAMGAGNSNAVFYRHDSCSEALAAGFTYLPAARGLIVPERMLKKVAGNSREIPGPDVCSVWTILALAPVRERHCERLLPFGRFGSTQGGRTECVWLGIPSRPSDACIDHSVFLALSQRHSTSLKVDAVQSFWHVLLFHCDYLK